MAGIGFELQKLYEGKKGFAKIKAYFFATLISSGPWIFSIFCLVAIGILSGTFFKTANMGSFSILIVYCFAGSLVLTGPIQFTLTRYLADQLFLKQTDRLLPALSTMLIFTAILTLITGVGAALYFKLSLLRGIFGVFFYMTISSIWVMMDFLSCLKNYKEIVRAFLIGVLITVVLIAGNVIFLRWPLIIFYSLGQFTIFILLLRSVLKEFKTKMLFIREIFTYFKIFPSIAVIGFFYSCGIWIDKIIFWIIRGERISGNFYAYPPYDISVYIAYLTIIPTLAHFIIKIETDFYMKYRKFYDSIIDKPVKEIKKNKIEMAHSFKKSFAELFVFQILITAAAYYFAGDVLRIFGAPESFIPVFRNLAIAACFHVMFLFTMIFMMYFDLRRTTTWIVILFFFLNVGLTIYSSTLDKKYLGMGYALSLAIPMFIGLVFMLIRLKNLEYTIFKNQPI
ncbi:MAG: exopolysaccharide Pel transporter PelG [Spirochaetes bacterium]|nr:exopolysaccharide Pel transporter PelG [Spirochaetota bacterium]